MSESILSITGRLTSVAELVMDIDPARLPESERDILRSRLPSWVLTLSAINASIAGLEERLLDD